MSKDIKLIIQKEIKERGQATSEKLAKLARVSRQAAHKQLAKLVKEKKLIKVGRTRKSYYIPYSTEKENELKKEKKPVRLRLKNKSLQEDLIFDHLALEANIIRKLPANAKEIYKYAFTEMVNNAIEHSQSQFINIEAYEIDNSICFKVADQGIGVFDSIKKKFKLKNDFEAIQELLKGKKTTAPKKHTGEGIFFTSKIADQFEIAGADDNLVIDNLLEEIFVQQIPRRKGTLVIFQIKKNSRKDLGALFREYTNEEYKFAKTKVTVKLYIRETVYLSRSQARRLLYDLEKFQTIVLDFNKIKGIGQGFADEIFRVFAAKHPEITISVINASPQVTFMIERAKKTYLQ